MQPSMLSQDHLILSTRRTPTSPSPTFSGRRRPRPIPGSGHERGTWTKAGSVQSLPLTARAEHEEDGLHAHAIGGARPAPAEAMRVFVFGEQQRNVFPQVVRDMPLVHDRHIHKNGVVHGCTSCAQLPSNNVSCTQ
jgi:hypothetical protein